MIINIPRSYFSKFNNVKYKRGFTMNHSTQTKGMILLYLEMKRFKQHQQDNYDNLYFVTLIELLELFCSSNNPKKNTYIKYMKDVRYSLDEIVKTTNWKICEDMPIDVKKIRVHTQIGLTYYRSTVNQFLTQQYSRFSSRQYKILMKPQYRSMRIKMLQVLGYITNNWVKVSPNHYKIQVSIKTIQNFTGVSDKTIRKIIQIFLDEKILERKQLVRRDINEYTQDLNTGKYIYDANIYYIRMYLHTSSYKNKNKKYRRKGMI